MNPPPRDPLTVRPRGWLAHGLVAIAYVGLYLLAALWGRDVGSVSAGALPAVTPWFPAVGLTVALLVGFGVRWAPLAFVAELISSVVIFKIDSTFSTAQVLLNAAAITAVFTVAAAVLRRVIRIDTSLRDVRSLVWLLVIAVGAAPLIAALAGVGMRVWAGADPGSEYWTAVRTWWVGEAIGIASVTPAVLTIGSALVNRRRPSLGPRSGRLQDVIQAVVVIGSPFALYAAEGPHHRLLFLTVFPVIWVAVTRGFLITSVAVLYTNAACTAAAHWQGLGGLDLTDAQTFMLTLAVMALGVAAVTRELRRSRAELAHQAAHDELTELPNRRTFFARLREVLESGDEVAVLFFDIDRLRSVGDSLGFEILDNLMVAIGARVADVVGQGCMTARYGGDEFAVLVHGPGAQHRGRELAQRLVDVLDRPFRLEGHELMAAAAIGVVTGGAPDEDAGRLLRRADLARAEAKRHGGRRWVEFDEELGLRAGERHALEHDLRGALDRAEMSVVFQPIYSLPAREVVYVESLVRWSHPTRGPVSPEHFIPLAEELGIVGDIFRFVVEVACQRASTWPSASSYGPPAVTVNISVSQLGDERLLTDLERSLARSGLPPGRLALEITESVALEDPERTVAFLERISALGVELMIDDFGAGYSSLGHLHRLPVSVVKVDRVFAGQLGDGAPGEAVVAAVVQLAAGLGLRVVAEGVESDEQLVHLRRLGCDGAQGWALARPLVPDALDALLEQPPAAVQAQAPWTSRPTAA